MDNIQFMITEDQAKAICEFYEEDIDQLDEWEVSELLDRLIEEKIYNLGDIKVV